MTFHWINVWRQQIARKTKFEIYRLSLPTRPNITRLFPVHRSLL